MALNDTQTGAASATFLTSCALNNALLKSYLSNLDTFSKEMEMIGITSIVQQKTLQDEGVQQKKAAIASGASQMVSGALGFAVSMYGEKAAGDAEKNVLNGNQNVQISGQQVPAVSEPAIELAPMGSSAAGQGVVGTIPEDGAQGSAVIEKPAPDKSASGTKASQEDTSEKRKTRAMEAGMSERSRYSNVYAPTVNKLIEGFGTALAGTYQNVEKDDEANAVDCQSAQSAASTEAGLVSSAMGNAEQMLATNGGSFSTIIQVSTSRV